MERDGSSERRVFDSYEVQPHPGQTVVLTIDQTIQYRTEQALLAPSSAPARNPGPRS